MTAYKEYDFDGAPPEIDPDWRLIHQAAVLAGRVDSAQVLSATTVEDFRLLLAEMRAETETLRLARRIAQHCGIKAPAVQSPCV